MHFLNLGVKGLKATPSHTMHNKSHHVPISVGHSLPAHSLFYIPMESTCLGRVGFVVI